MKPRSIVVLPGCPPLQARLPPYRVPAPREAPRPAAPRVVSWEHLLRPRSVLAATMLASLPGLAITTSYLAQRWPEAAAWTLPALPALPVLGFVALLRLSLFLCPRCRDLFFIKRWFCPWTLPDALRIWHCPHCHVRTGIPGPLR